MQKSDTGAYRRHGHQTFFRLFKIRLNSPSAFLSLSMLSIILYILTTNLFTNKLNEKNLFLSMYMVIPLRPVHMKQNIDITCWFSSLNRFRGKMLLSGAVWHSIGNYVVCWLDFTWWCPVMKCTSMFPYSIYPDIDFQYWWMTYQYDSCSAECRNLNFDQTKWFFMSLWLGATTSLWWGQV